jgi:hypothetical protein
MISQGTEYIGGNTDQSLQPQASLLFLSPEEMIQDSFSRFKQRLRTNTEKWLASKNIKSRSVVQVSLTFFFTLISTVLM